jgi:hypothetical protein
MTTGQIAKAIGRSVPRTSNILGALRLAELVRYETKGRHSRYRLKYSREVRKVLYALSGFVNHDLPNLFVSHCIVLESLRETKREINACFEKGSGTRHRFEPAL